MAGLTLLSKHAKKLESLFWTVMEHTSYSSEFSACDYHIFDSLKGKLGGQIRQ